MEGEQKIIEILSSLTEKVDLLSTLNEKFDSMTEKVVLLSGKVDTILEVGATQDQIHAIEIRLDGIEKSLENTATKTELNEFKDEVLTTLDQQGVILQRLDQEHLFTLERIKRIERDVEVLKSK